MGYYTEYLDKKLPFDQLTTERKKQLKRISELREGRDVLVIAADLNKNAPITIQYNDILAVTDQLFNLKGTALDLILETPGGSGEVAEDIVRLLHGKYKEVGVIVPGYAKSAGTIMTMAGDEILMDQASALGPIDAQLSWQGKVFSADALLEGMEKIKREVEQTGILNKTYVPILQGISPGELQAAENALEFAKILVAEWLAKYKFKSWEKHSSTGNLVTEEEKKKRADEIAMNLCDHRHWRTHARSIKIDDLQKMGLRVSDFSTNLDLAEAIRRYYALLQLTFATNIYKVFETPNSQIYRFIVPTVPEPQQSLNPDNVVIEVDCPNCKKKSVLQANLGIKQPIQRDLRPFPENNKFICPNCKTQIDLSDARRQLEAQTKKRIVS